MCRIDDFRWRPDNRQSTLHCKDNILHNYHVQSSSHACMAYSDCNRWCIRKRKYHKFVRILVYHQDSLILSFYLCLMVHISYGHSIIVITHAHSSGVIGLVVVEGGSVVVVPDIISFKSCIWCSVWFNLSSTVICHWLIATVKDWKSFWTSSILLLTSVILASISSLWWDFKLMLWERSLIW